MSEAPRAPAQHPEGDRRAPIVGARVASTHESLAAPAHAPSSDRDAAIFAITRPHRNLLWLYALTALIGLVAAPIVFVPLYFKYYTLRYAFDAEGVSARWGILFRREIYLTYKRIQDIHVKRNIVERWLGIGTIQVQTASGSSSAELSIEGMPDYEAVRDFLYRRMRGHEIAKNAGTTSASPPLVAGDEDAVAILHAIRDELEAARRALEARG